MFFQLLFIHLFRPFLKYTAATSPLPSNVSPRKLCTQAAATISKLLRLYKRSHGLRQICNIAVYIAHSACTIHLLNLPDKNARRDIIHGVKHLEEIAEGWLGARRSLGILSVLANRWNAPLPYEAKTLLTRTDVKFGPYKGDNQSPAAELKQPTLRASLPPFGQKTTSTVPPTSSFAAIDPSSTLYTPAAMDTVIVPQMHDPSRGSTSVSGQFPGLRQPSSSRTSELLPPPRSASSPSAMFGGIEQLLRDSQDWVYKDQAQFGTGFGNWNGSDDDLATAPWTNTRHATNAVYNGTTTQQGIPTASGLGGSHVFATQPPSSLRHQNQNPEVPKSWTDGINGMVTTNMYNSLMTYNEDEWYQ